MLQRLLIENIWKVKLFNLSIDVIGTIDVICRYSQSGPQTGSRLKTLSKVQFSNQTYMAESEPACYDELIPELEAPASTSSSKCQWGEGKINSLWHNDTYMEKIDVTEWKVTPMRVKVDNMKFSHWLAGWL